MMQINPLNTEISPRLYTPSEKSTALISSFPNELIFEIFNTLNDQDLYSVREVCKNWEVVAKSEMESRSLILSELINRHIRYPLYEKKMLLTVEEKFELMASAAFQFYNSVRFGNLFIKTLDKCRSENWYRTVILNSRNSHDIKTLKFTLDTVLNKENNVHRIQLHRGKVYLSIFKLNKKKTSSCYSESYIVCRDMFVKNQTDAKVVFQDVIGENIKNKKIRHSVLGIVGNSVLQIYGPNLCITKDFNDKAKGKKCKYVLPSYDYNKAKYSIAYGGKYLFIVNIEQEKKIFRKKFMCSI